MQAEEVTNPLYAPRIAEEEALRERIVELEERCRRVGARIVVALKENEKLCIDNARLRVKCQEEVSHNVV